LAYSRTQINLFADPIVDVLSTTGSALRVSCVDAAYLLGNISSSLRSVYATTVLLDGMVEVKDGVVDKAFRYGGVGRVVCIAPSSRWCKRL
jgi:hypothetical protein